MQLVERHVSSRADPRFAAIDAASFASKNLYNAANYLVWQSVMQEGVYLTYHEMRRHLQDHEASQALSTKVAQWALGLLDQNWQRFFAALAAGQADPAECLGRPRLPGYKDKQQGRHRLLYPVQALSGPSLRAGVIAPARLSITVATRQPNDQQARIIPRHGFSVVEVIDEQAPPPAHVDPALGAGVDTGVDIGVDIGIDKLATLTADKRGFIPRIVNGRPVQSINQFDHKRTAELPGQWGRTRASHRIERLTLRRTRRIDHSLHTASRRSRDLLVVEGSGALIIGKTPLWQQAVHLGRRTNQQIVAIAPARFVEMLSYKAELVGIQVIVTDESYTSKARFLDADPLPVNGSGRVPAFSGRRVKRGLYRAADGTPIHADVNGAYTIMRKVAPEAFAQGSRGCVVHPMRLAA